MAENVNILVSSGPHVRTEAPVAAGGNDPSGRTGRRPSAFVSEEEKVFVYYPKKTGQGYDGAWVPKGHLQTFKNRGFTEQPTAEWPDAPFECPFCPKEELVEQYGREPFTRGPFRAIDRINLHNHIKAYHGSSYTIMSPEEKQALGLPFTQDDRIQILLQHGTGVGGAAALATPAGGDSSALEAILQRMNEMQAELEALKSDKPKPLYKDTPKTGHADNCVTFGRLGKYTPDCPRCEAILAKKVADRAALAAVNETEGYTEVSVDYPEEGSSA